MSVVGVIDLGIGNIGSVANMLRRVGGDVEVIRDGMAIGRYEKLILPGVGSFDTGMRRLEEQGLDTAVRRHVLEKGGHLLGICLGMQLLFEGSEEGSADGLALIPGKVVRFEFSGCPHAEKIPHMGWSEIRVRTRHPLFAELETGSRFYFVHSYHARCDDQYLIASARYSYEFPCAVTSHGVVGVQFHPEKSHRFGMRLIKNFLEL